MAVSGDGRRWWLVNATPDVLHQIYATEALHPGPGPRDSPISGVLLTDAEFDHTIGLLMLREGASLEVFGTLSVLKVLDSDFPIRRLLSRYADFTWREFSPGTEVVLEERLAVTPIDLGDRLPRYSEAGSGDGAVLAFVFSNPETGRSALWAPQVGSWTEQLLAVLDRVDVAFIDGTFWTADEMVRAGAGTLRASDMGHLPVAGPGGIAEQLANSGTRSYLVHVNNTNPLFDPSSPERRQLQECGVALAEAGLTLEL